MLRSKKGDGKLPDIVAPTPNICTVRAQYQHAYNLNCEHREVGNGNEKNSKLKHQKEWFSPKGIASIYAYRSKNERKTQKQNKTKQNMKAAFMVLWPI